MVKVKSPMGKKGLVTPRIRRGFQGGRGGGGRGQLGGEKSHCCQVSKQDPNLSLSEREKTEHL